jgi:hypothetical protein
LLETWKTREERERLRQQLAAEERRRQAEEELGRESWRLLVLRFRFHAWVLCGWYIEAEGGVARRVALAAARGAVTHVLHCPAGG